MVLAAVLMLVLVALAELVVLVATGVKQDLTVLAATVVVTATAQTVLVVLAAVQVLERRVDTFLVSATSL